MTPIDPPTDGPPANGHDGNGHDGNGTTGAAVVAAHRPVVRSLPRPVVKKSRLPSLLVWIIPLATAVGGAYYFHRIWGEIGPEVVIKFDDVTGIKTGETPLVVHGVRVATVTAVDLDPDNVHADVHVRFQRGTANIANAGTVFYLVQPDVSGGNVRGLSTLITGPYITAIVGRGAPSTTFTGLDGPPVMRGAGMRVVIHAPRVDQIGIDAPIYYRGMQVGVVQDVRLSEDSTGVNVTAFVWLRYARLLRTNSVFWPLTTADVKGSLLSGIQVQLGSLRTLLGGGLAFATPETNAGRLAQDGTDYTLTVDGPRLEWLTWAPKIPLGPDPLSDVETGHGAQREQGFLQSMLRVR